MKYIVTLLMFGSPVLLAAISHMVVVRIGWFSFLKIPLDFRKTFRSKRVFGDNKTIRGIIVMILFSFMYCHILELLIAKYPGMNDYNLLHFNRYPSWLYGILYGLGYTLSELPNSFYKRQINLKPGRRGNIMNILIDQVDSVIGCFIILVPFSDLTIKWILMGIIFYAFVHLIVNLLLYITGIRENPL